MQDFGISKEYSLSDGKIHLWEARLSHASKWLSELGEVLSPEEQQRADQFHFEIDRTRHIVTRGLLRMVLARLLRAKPKTIQFGHNNSGKPHLSESSFAADIQFNVSHSGDLVLIGVVIHRSIGVDIERVQGAWSVEEIAKHSFSSREYAELMALDLSLRQEAFFACWTRKEALVKAIGGGLSMRLDQFDESLLGLQPMHRIITYRAPGSSINWTLQDYHVDDGYKAAIAFNGSNCHVSTWRWPPSNR